MKRHILSHFSFCIQAYRLQINQFSFDKLTGSAFQVSQQTADYLAFNQTPVS